MRNKKKIIIVVAAVMLLGGCAGNNTDTEEAKTSEQSAEGDTEQENLTTVGAEDSTDDSVSGTDSGTGESAENTDAKSTEGADGMAVPVVNLINCYDYIYDEGEEDNCLAYVSLDGFSVDSDGFDELSDALHSYNLQVKEDSGWFVNEVNECKPSYDEPYDYADMWQYENRAEVTRTDAVVFSGYENIYAYTGQSDSRDITRGFAFDISDGKKLEFADICSNIETLAECVTDKLKENPDAGVFGEDWESEAGEALRTSEGCSFYLTDDSLEIAFEPGIVAATDGVTAKLPYTECDDFMNEKYMNNAERVCHRMDDYGEYCLEYSFDADKDGKDELLQIDEDINKDENNYVVYVTPIISFGRDAGSLISVRGDEFMELDDSYVIETDDGRFYLYVEVICENDYHLLLIYDVSDPDEGPVYMGQNTTGAFYEYAPSGADCLYVADRVEAMGSYSGYLSCHVGENGQLVADPEGDPEYIIRNTDPDRAFSDVSDYDAPAVSLTLLQDIDEYVYDIRNGEGETQTLKAGTKLCPYECGGDGSYMTFRIDKNSYVTLSYDDFDEDSWERTIEGIPEEEVLEGMVYAG